MENDYENMLKKKLKEIETLPIQDMYKLPEFQRDGERVYTEALGLESVDELKDEQAALLIEISPQKQSDLNTHSSTSEGRLLEEILQNSTVISEEIIKQQSKGYQQVSNRFMPIVDKRQPKPTIQQIPGTVPPVKFNLFSEVTPQILPRNNIQQQVEFEDLTISLKYTTQFGEDLRIVGSLPCLGSWNPNANALKMTWSEGHVWSAKLPKDKMRGPLSQLYFEFKFVVMVNGKTSRWEGGQQNHIYNGSIIHKFLLSDEIQSHIQERQKQNSVVKIGTFDGGLQGKLHIHGSNSERVVPDSPGKAKLSYDIQNKEIRFHQYFQF